MKEFDRNKQYLVDGVMLQYVQSVMDRLYKHDFKSINADESRDMANGLNAHLEQNTEEIPPGYRLTLFVQEKENRQ